MNLIKDKYIRIETIFFLVYYFLFNILTDIEYNLYENRNYMLFLKAVPSRLIYGVVYIIPFWICYKMLIQGYLFKHRYLPFLLLLIIFLFMLNFYFKYSNWLISQLPFLPAEVISSADNYYRADVLVHFSLIYILRELLVISSLGYFIRSARQDEVMNAVRQKQLETELNYLKVQIQPHFFFNTLNSIYSLTLQRSAQAAPLVARHADMMRYILYDSTNQRVKLSQEIRFLADYSQVESVRYADKISIQFDSQGIDEHAMIAPLLLLPFIENAFKHGAGDAIEGGYIKIVVCMVAHELMLEVMNSKPSPEHTRTQEKGIGLQNAVKRLELLYPRRHQLEINDRDANFSVRLTIQLA